jgi:hypothetical protein
LTDGDIINHDTAPGQDGWSSTDLHHKVIEFMGSDIWYRWKKDGGKRAELCAELAALLVREEFVTAERQADLAAALHKHITSFTSLSENEQLFWESGHWFSIGRYRPQTARIVVGATDDNGDAMREMGYDPQVR